LLQCPIHKLSRVGKDKAAWAKAYEYLTNLMDSDTMLTVPNGYIALGCLLFLQEQIKDIIIISRTPTKPSSVIRITLIVRTPTGKGKQPS
jgi:hypothetical protein